jgi:hypothetical protein
MGLSGSIPAGSTTATLTASLPSTLANRVWIAFDPYTSGCEIAKLTGYGSTISFTPAVQNAHTSGAYVTLLEEGVLTPQLFGATGDGTSTSDNGALRLAVNAAARAGLGTISVPPGVYQITQTVPIYTAVRIVGLGSGPGGNSTVGNNDEHGAILEHNFTGDLFSVQGVLDDGTASVGTAFENLLLRQSWGNGTGNANVSTAIHVSANTACSGYNQCDGSKPSWLRIRNVTFEVGTGADDWYRGIWLDGSSTSGPLCGSGIRDTWIDNIRITSGSHADSSIYANTVGNLFLSNAELNLVNGTMIIDGPNTTSTSCGQPRVSSVVELINVGASQLRIGNAQIVTAYGGSWSSLSQFGSGTCTSCALYPSYLNSAPTWNATESILNVGVYGPTSGGSLMNTSELDFQNGMPATIGTKDSQQLRFKTNNALAGMFDIYGNFEIWNPGKGLILRDASANCWLVTVSTSGALGTSLVSCP